MNLTRPQVFFFVFFGPDHLTDEGHIYFDPSILDQKSEFFAFLSVEIIYNNLEIKSFLSVRDLLQHCTNCIVSKFNLGYVEFFSSFIGVKR